MASDRNDNSDRRLSELCKALGYPIRIQILRILREKGACISGELSDLLPVSQSTTSEHLRIMKQSGLIKMVDDGNKRAYCLDMEVIKDFKSLIKNLGGNANTERVT